MAAISTERYTAWWRQPSRNPIIFAEPLHPRAELPLHFSTPLLSSSSPKETNIPGEKLFPRLPHSFFSRSGAGKTRTNVRYRFSHSRLLRSLHRFSRFSFRLLAVETNHALLKKRIKNRVNQALLKLELKLNQFIGVYNIYKRSNYFRRSFECFVKNYY